MKLFMSPPSLSPWCFLRPTMIRVVAAKLINLATTTGPLAALNRVSGGKSKSRYVFIMVWMDGSDREIRFERCEGEEVDKERKCVVVSIRHWNYFTEISQSQTIARKKCWHYSFKMLTLNLSANWGTLHVNISKRRHINMFHISFISRLQKCTITHD